MVQIFVMLILTQSNILNKTSDVDAADIRCLLGMRWLWFVEYFIQPHGFTDMFSNNREDLFAVWTRQA